MNLTAIEMAPQVAREAFLDYREAVRDHRRLSPYPEDKELMRAYRALAKGERIIQLTEALRAGGTTLLTCPGVRWDGGRYVEGDVELPKIAVGRADRGFVWCGGITASGGVEMVTKTDRAPNNRRDVVQRAAVFPRDRERNTTGVGWDSRGVPRAIVPIIPPKLRPKRTRLSEFHVLFEAEWAVHTPPPPVDPALLRHLGGDLYAVVAVWELTEVERAVLALRR
jgi:hypothetical protein